MSSTHATELASLTSEVRRIENLMKELAAKKATLLAAIARIRLASLSDDVLALVLRDLPREALLRLRLTGQDVCARVSMLLSDERVPHAPLRMAAPRAGQPRRRGRCGGVSAAALQPVRNQTQHVVIGPHCASSSGR